MIGRTSHQGTGGTHTSRYVRHSALNERPVWCAVRTTKALNPGGESIENLILCSKLISLFNRRKLKLGSSREYSYKGQSLCWNPWWVQALCNISVRNLSHFHFSPKNCQCNECNHFLSVRINPKLLFKLSHFDSIFHMEKSHSSRKYYSLNTW